MSDTTEPEAEMDVIKTTGQLAQVLIDSLPPQQLLDVWFQLTAVLRGVYGVRAEGMIDCVRGTMTRPDGSIEHAWATEKRNIRVVPTTIKPTRGKGS